jgi:DNA-binding transcriptional LysR family regulator
MLHLSGVVASFLERYPAVTVEVTLSDRYVDLVAEGIDVAVRIGRLRDSNLIARWLAPCRMVLCAAPRYLEKSGPLRTIADVRKQPRLAFSDAVSTGDWTLMGPDGNSHVIDGPIRLTANNMQMLLAAALEGQGITYGPTFVFDEYLASGQLVALLPNYRASELAIHAVYPSNRHVPLKLRRFVDHLSASLNAPGQVSAAS